MTYSYRYIIHVRMEGMNETWYCDRYERDSDNVYTLHGGWQPHQQEPPPRLVTIRPGITTTVTTEKVA